MRPAPSTLSVAAASSRPACQKIVVAIHHNGLGNQLFQWAFGKLVALDAGAAACRAKMRRTRAGQTAKRTIEGADQREHELELDAVAAMASSCRLHDHVRVHAARERCLRHAGWKASRLVLARLYQADAAAKCAPPDSCGIAI